MSINMNSQLQDTEAQEKSPRSTSSRLISRIGLFVVLLICSLLIYPLGPNYYKLFPTNGNPVYAAALAIIFLVVALLCKRSQKFSRYWVVAYGLFIASTVVLISDLFSGYNTDFVQFFGSTNPNQTLALAKVYDTLLVVVPIIFLTLISGANLGSLYLKLGNRNSKWGIGIGVLVVVNFLTSALIFHGTEYKPAELVSVIIWGFVFAFSNSLLEELWVRGLFLKKYIPLIGTTGAILLTSLVFASLHFLSIAYLPPSTIPVFVANTLTLGLACGILMVKTDSIWGAYLIHAAADWYLFIATLAVH
jgi:membrane protease YdiL (CAAX protease family)